MGFFFSFPSPLFFLFQTACGCQCSPSFFCSGSRIRWRTSTWSTCSFYSATWCQEKQAALPFFFLYCFFTVRPIHTWSRLLCSNSLVSVECGRPGAGPYSFLDGGRSHGLLPVFFLPLLGSRACGALLLPPFSRNAFYAAHGTTNRCVMPFLPLFLFPNNGEKLCHTSLPPCSHPPEKR